MLKSEKLRQRPAIKAMHQQYEYWDRVPHRGLSINGKPAITQIDTAAIGEYLIYMVRDPLAVYGKDPAEELMEHMQDVCLAGQSGLFTTYTGTYKGARISVCSGGSGCGEVELAMNDFMEFTDCDVFLRVGVSGGVSEEAEVGDCVISTGIFREDGASRAYIEDGFPAFCSYEIVGAMTEAAHQLKFPVKLGVTACMDSDFVGNGRPSVGGYLQPRNIEKLATYNRAGVLNTDRESSILVTMCNLFGRRGGAVFSITDNIVANQPFQEGSGTQDAIKLALEGLAILKKMDRAKALANHNHWAPSMGLVDE